MRILISNDDGIYSPGLLALAESRPELRLVNVNLPPRPHGMTWTSLSFRHYDGHVVPGQDPMGRHHYWYTVVPIEEIEDGTERWAMREERVSLTPLRLDLTDETLLQNAIQSTALKSADEP